MKHISSIAFASALAAFSQGANAACTPGGFVGYDGTTLTVDTTGCSLKVQDSSTGQSSTFSAGALTQSDGTNSTSLLSGGLVTTDGSNVSYIVPGGVVSENATSYSYMVPGGFATTNGANSAVVTPTAVNVFDGSNATSVYANGVSTTGSFLASDGAGNFSQTSAYGTFVGDSAGNATFTTATGVWTTGTIAAVGPSSAGVVSSTRVGVVNVNGSAGATVQSNGQVAVGVQNAAGQNQFYASSDGTISAEGNRVQNVAAPIAPTDAANKAYVDQNVGALAAFTSQRFTKVGGGIAAATALGNPDRTGNQTWALSLSEGFYDKYNATALNGIASIGNIGGFDVAFGGGVAFTDHGDVSGRVTAQIAGGGYQPMK